MKKIFIWSALIVIILVSGYWYVWVSKKVSVTPPVIVISGDYKNIAYSISGASVPLVNGHAETSTVPNSASKTVTQYFGNEAVGDLNGDGIPDRAFLLTQSGAGSGVFYYIVVAVKTESGYQGTSAILLGDRIAPQTTEIRNGELIVNYADRNPGEPMTTKPSLGVSKYLKVSGQMLQEVSH